MTTPLSPSPTLRVLNLEGGCNFRDLGGYRTRDNREFKWGRVYRTGVLSYFTPNDHQQLNQLGVRAICDLRSAKECEREPTHWPDTNTQHLNWDGGKPPTIGLFMANHPYTAPGVHLAMMAFYRALPAWLVPRLRGMFERIALGDVPVLVHCSQGKDRTGVAIALLLAALDVPHETIFEDYLLTNTAGDFIEFIVARDPAHQPVLTMPEDIRRVIFMAHADYLHGAFVQIARDHGDVSEYLRKEVGVDEAMRTKMQAALLSAG